MPKTRLGNLLMFYLIQDVLYLLLYHNNISIMPENNSMDIKVWYVSSLTVCEKALR